MPTPTIFHKAVPEEASRNLDNGLESLRQAFCLASAQYQKSYDPKYFNNIKEIYGRFRSYDGILTYELLKSFFGSFLMITKEKAYLNHTSDREIPISRKVINHMEEFNFLKKLIQDGVDKYHTDFILLQCIKYHESSNGIFKELLLHLLQHTKAWSVSGLDQLSRLLFLKEFSTIKIEILNTFSTQINQLNHLSIVIDVISRSYAFPIEDDRLVRQFVTQLLEQDNLWDDLYLSSLWECPQIEQWFDQDSIFRTALTDRSSKTFTSDNWDTIFRHCLINQTDTSPLLPYLSTYISSQVFDKNFLSELCIKRANTLYNLPELLKVLIEPNLPDARLLHNNIYDEYRHKSIPDLTLVLEGIMRIYHTYKSKTCGQLLLELIILNCKRSNDLTLSPRIILYLLDKNQSMLVDYLKLDTKYFSNADVIYQQDYQDYQDYYEAMLSLIEQTIKCFDAYQQDLLDNGIKLQDSAQTAGTLDGIQRNISSHLNELSSASQSHVKLLS